MALQLMDNFHIYGIGGQAHMLNGIYAENSECTLVADPDPSGDGMAVCRHSPPSTNNIVRRVLTSAQATVGFAARYWLALLPGATTQRPSYVSFRDVSNVGLCCLTVDPSGYLEVYKTEAINSGDLLARSATPVIVANAWQHVETKIHFDAAVGTVEVRVNGVTAITASGLDTSPTGNLCQNVGPGYLASGDTGPYLYTKDHIIWDGSGALNNDFFGTCRVVDMTPDADISLNWALTGGASGFSILDVAPPNDANYIASASGVAAYVASLSDLPIDVTTVKALQTVYRSDKSDAGDGNVQASLISSGTTGDGTDRPQTTAFTFYSDPYDADPHTSAGWTVAAANAVELKLNRTL